MLHSPLALLLAASQAALPTDTPPQAPSPEATARGPATEPGRPGAVLEADRPAEPTVEPPILLDGAEVPWPTDGAGQEAAVVLLLTIDENGVVLESEVVGSGGEAFDQVAREASLSFFFEPAKVDGTPVACQIEFVQHFRQTRAVADQGIAGADPTADATDADATEGGDVPGVEDEEPPTFEAVVRDHSVAEEKRQSAQAVKIVEIREARSQSADLGQVLARQEGVEVRRTGGLGSTARFALNGLADDQIRFFLDGVPLELSGYPLGIANVPVNLIERVDIYRGVVPIRLGADALGGAVDLIRAPLRGGSHGAASLQVGSFGTARLALSGSHLHETSGFFARGHFFADTTENDYGVDVDVANERGQMKRAHLERFHDGYQALGGGLELGVQERPFADRLALRVFGSTSEKELQHNLVMRGVPYGEAEYGTDSWGGQLLYEKAFSDFHVEAIGGIGWQSTDFLDVSDWVYDWYGRRVSQRTRPGELGEYPTDQTIWQRSTYARGNFAWDVAEGHTLRLSLAPTLTSRTGEERRDTPNRQALEGERTLTTLVTGLEWEVDLFDDHLEVIVFAKDYRYAARAEEPRAGGGFRERNLDLDRLGGGVATRLRLGGPVMLKASYERATRLPRADELFGNGVLIHENLDLVPETSHNLNLGLATAPIRTDVGAFRGEINGFARLTENLIVLLGTDRDWRFQNVFGADAFGVEGAAGWTSPEGLVHLDANATFQDVRNTSGEGTFGDFEGARLPNRPWFFANAAARLSIRNVATDQDELSPFWNLRYVHEFFRGWEGAGRLDTKDMVPGQWLQTAGVGYRLSRGEATFGLTAEVENLADSRTFDFFGVQRPGRATWIKGTVEY